MRTLIITAAALTVASPAVAQAASDLAATTPAPSPAWSVDSRLTAPVDATLLPADAAQQALPQRQRRGGVVGRSLVPAAIGAVLGSWVGYVASQVSRSDWDKESNSEFNSYRLGFAAGGAAVGALTGALIGNNLGGSTPAGTPRSLAADTRTTISPEEKQATTTARNAFELIQSLRPRWLSTRGTNSPRETAQGTGSGGPGTNQPPRVEVTPGESSLKVYMDNVLMGDVSVLRQIAINSFTEVHYFDSARATHRWGGGHMGGAIELITRPVTN